MKIEFTFLCDKMPWAKAKETCTARGAQLVKPDSQDKNKFIKEKLETLKKTDSSVDIGGDNSDTWIGAKRNPADKAQFLYTDGSAVQGFTNWASGKATNSHAAMTYYHINWLKTINTMLKLIKENLKKKHV